VIAGDARRGTRAAQTPGERMSMFDELKDKAADAIKDNPDKLEQVSDSLLDKAADLADGATGGKFHDKIEGLVEKADGAIGE
jgi:hypothetical protein